MKLAPYLALPGLLLPLHANAQGPFEFREASLLMNRIESQRHATQYDPVHSEQWMSRVGPSAATPFLPDRADPHVYSDTRWLGLLAQVNQYRDMGGYDIAEKGYLDIIAMLRKVQAPATSDLAWVLDQLAEFYLEQRDFDKAYQSFTQAIDIRRHNIAALTSSKEGVVTDAMRQEARSVLYALGTDPNDAAAARKVCRVHLADLLTQLGRLEMARDDLKHADERLGEAVVIFNENGYKQFPGSLNALYFQSMVLEKQGRWSDAEIMWKAAIALRETMQSSRAYWDALKEMAAFYARRGDFHTAAELAHRAETGLAEPRRPAFPMPYPIHARPWMELDPQADTYAALSSAAMNEIEAVDVWRTQGPEAAAAQLKDPLTNQTRMLLGAGADSERAQTLAWLQQGSDLRMSILIDGTLSDERIAKAYDLLGAFKGHYLACSGEINRIVQVARSNPNISTSDLATIDQLTAARQRHAALFIQTALNGKPYEIRQFAQAENVERVLTAALLNGPHPVGYERFASRSLPAQVRQGALFIDYVAWSRTERSNGNQLREYGAFVAAEGRPVRFVRLGAAGPIDAQIDALNRLAIDGRMRGLRRVENATLGADQVLELLRGLHAKLIEPLQIPEGARLLLVPDGKISLTPIGALVRADGHFLLEHHSIAYLNSWRDLRAPTHPPASQPVIVANPDFALLVGKALKSSPDYPVFEPLPGTLAEAAATAQTLKLRQERVLIGKAARKGLVQSLRGPAILHLATHSEPYLQWQAPRAGLSLFEHPQPLTTTDPFLQSIIALAGAGQVQGGEDNGLLTGLEIASLDLQGTLLAVLSSCESAQGTPVDGQGILGLRAAFSLAGAESLVMSLWPVDDQAGVDFMGYFYSHIDSGTAESVRLAQLDMLANPKYRNPFFWAGYVSSGDAPAIDLKALHSADLGGDEVLATPLCMEISTREARDSRFLTRDTLKVKIGGAMRRTRLTASLAEYELDGPADDLTEIISTEFNGNTVQPIEIKHANAYRWNVQMILEKQANQSALSIRFGGPNYPKEQHRMITLRGAPSLFGSLNPPSSVPELTSLTQNSDSASQQALFERVGACRAE